MRFSGLPGFPFEESGRNELARVLRRITQTDFQFLDQVITTIMDKAKVCPTPAEVLEIAGEKRYDPNQPIGDPDCPQCHGVGFVGSTQLVAIGGLAPYEADVAVRCQCRDEATGDRS